MSVVCCAGCAAKLKNGLLAYLKIPPRIWGCKRVVVARPRSPLHANAQRQGFSNVAQSPHRCTSSACTCPQVAHPCQGQWRNTCGACQRKAEGNSNQQKISGLPCSGQMELRRQATTLP